MSEIDRSLASGLAWTATMRWVAQLFSWLSTLYAARLLAPGDYGLIAMAMLAIGLARMVEDFGLDAILVQDRTIAGSAMNQLAGFVLLIALVLMAIFWAISTPVATFFSEPAVAQIIVVLSLLFVTDALQVVSRALLQRRLQYRRIALLHLVQSLATGTGLVVAVTVGLGYWSLVVNMLTGAVAATVLSYVWAPYGIALPREFRRLARPLLQGWRILASRAFYYAYSSADQTIIGKVLNKDALGVYSFATTFSTFTSSEVTGVVSRVVPGIFSEVQGNKLELRRYFLLLTGLLATMTFPMLFGTALVSDVFIPVVLGPQWDAVIVPLRLLCIYAAYTASQILLAHVMMWTGQFRAQMWCSLVPALVMPPALWFAATWYGLDGIVWAWVLVYPIANLPPFFIGFRTINVRVTDWMRAMYPAIAASAAMALAVVSIRWVMPDTTPPPLALGAAVAMGVLAYTAAMWFGFRPHLMEFFALMKSLRSPKPSSAP